MYNIAVICLQFIWFGNAFSLVRSIYHAPRGKKLYIFSPWTKKCIIGHGENIHFCRIFRKMYSLTDLTHLSDRTAQTSAADGPIV